jgi:arginyl-tRNA synthetase
MLNNIKKQLESILINAGVEEKIEFTKPPKSDMGDIAFACFEFAKQTKSNPVDVAKELKNKLETENLELDIVDRVEAFGPYVNFFLNNNAVAKLVCKSIDETFGEHVIGKGKKYLIEFAQPNPFKAFHIGHLKNIITGEAVARTFENAGYDVVRINYQGDVGMHVAKALWGIFDLIDTFESVKETSLKERVEFLGEAYAHGAVHFEKGDKEKQEVIVYNDKVYESDASIQEVYITARQWSLDYFADIYVRMGSFFDRLYFESEVFERGVDLVKKGQEKNIFLESEGAIIFPGSEYGLHDRVYINSKGFPTYDAKELALAEMHFQEYSPDKVIHVVGKEQTEYFKVAFKALEQIHPETVGKEMHLIGGFLQLKGAKKMSSRSGNIVTGDQLIDEVRERIKSSFENNDAEKNSSTSTLDVITYAALKYAMLKADVSKDVAFDMEESVSTTGDSGPYLLYIVARIKSILRKVDMEKTEVDFDSLDIHEKEKQLLLQLSAYPIATRAAVETYDPSKIAKYLFELAQTFNAFYEHCPVVKSSGQEQLFRVQLLQKVLQVMKHGLTILGIKTVDKM